MDIKLKHILVISILLLFYTVGIVGILWGDRASFLSLTPLNLLLTFGVFIWGNNIYKMNFLVPIVIVGAIGYGVEVAGVHTGVLFGEYQYGSPLGWKVFDVPLMIGVNWILLSFTAFGIGEKLITSKSLRLLVAALMMTLLDFIIEPVAIELNFWQWGGGEIPIQNYVMWFITAFIIQGILLRFNYKMEATVSLFVFGIQVYFFSALNLLL